MLVWKESMRLTRRIRRQGIDLTTTLERNPRLRFIHPVRNPLDCALSNSRTGHDALLDLGDATARIGSREDLTVGEILDLVLDDLRWYLDQMSAHSDRMFLLVEGLTSAETFVELGRFLGLPADERWPQEAFDLFTVDTGYDHDPALVERYLVSVRARFGDHPALQAHLCSFADR